MGKIKYLLDTNICIHFIKNDQNVVNKIREIGFINCYISEITLLELLYGVANSESSRKAKNREILKNLELSFDDRILRIYTAFEEFANQKALLRKSGKPISDFDMLIACTALQHNLTLVSRNTKEMNRIENLVLENWID